MVSDLERILDPSYIDDIEDLPTDQLRAMRSECEAHEEAVSYARRLVQGRLDILRAELLRRREGGDPSAEPLLAQLPSILAGDQARSGPLEARATRLRVPAAAGELEAEVDGIVDEATLDDLAGQGPDRLAQLVERLAAHEHQLSTKRQKLFDRIDALRAELAARYKDGRAVVRDLINGP